MLYTLSEFSQSPYNLRECMGPEATYPEGGSHRGSTNMEDRAQAPGTHKHTHLLDHLLHGTLALSLYHNEPETTERFD